jgi:phosphatidylglycerol---prolipoprotein diacylglyceryl transferase
LYPNLPFNFFFGIEISTFGLMMAVGFLAGGWLFASACERAGYDRDTGWTVLSWALIGGLLGAKLWYVAEMVAREGAGDLSRYLWNRGGLTWYGGLVGGTLGVLIVTRLRGLSLAITTDCAAAPVALGQALGRIGCFLVGDDYGRPTDLPWGVAFPQGQPATDVPVHPTMLYEGAWLFFVAWLLHHRAGQSPNRLAEYLVLAGAGRLLNETLRTNPALIGPLSNAQVTALVCVLLGAGAWLYVRRQQAVSAA